MNIIKTEDLVNNGLTDQLKAYGFTLAAIRTHNNGYVYMVYKGDDLIMSLPVSNEMFIKLGAGIIDHIMAKVMKITNITVEHNP